MSENDSSVGRGGGREGLVLLGVVLLAGVAIFGGRTARNGGLQGSRGSVVDPPRSVILLIGDGMGPQEIGLHLDVADAVGRETALERAFTHARTSTVRTGSAISPVTDSAASATAMATGVETRNGSVGVDVDGGHLRTCLEDARDTGRGTAIVTSTRLSHATPASFAAHVPDRNLENEIAREMLGQGFDILLGGGAIHFLGGLGGQNLAPLIEKTGFRLVRSSEELADAPESGPLLGLFHGDNLPYVVDRDGDEGEPTHIPTLRELTEAALERLDPEQGFFLMVEGGRIDHAGHANDAGTLLGEMREFDDTLALLLDYVADRPEIALIVTADHETGGLSLTYRPDALPTTDDLRALDATEGSAKIRLAETVDRDRALATFGSAGFPFVADVAWGVNAPALERSASHFVSFATGGHTATPITMLHIGAGAPFPNLMTHADLGKRLRAWMSVPAPDGEH